MMMQDDERWAWVSKRQAARYRWIASMMSNPVIAERLRKIADDYEAEGAAAPELGDHGEIVGDE